MKPGEAVLHSCGVSHFPNVLQRVGARKVDGRASISRRGLLTAAVAAADTHAIGHPACIFPTLEIVFLKLSKFGIFKPTLNGGSNTGAVLTLHTLSDTTLLVLSRKHLILGMFQKHGRLYQLLTRVSPLLAQEMV